jgi:hypothetical protein
MFDRRSAKSERPLSAKVEGASPEQILDFSGSRASGRSDHEFLIEQLKNLGLLREGIALAVFPAGYATNLERFGTPWIDAQGRPKDLIFAFPIEQEGGELTVEDAILRYMHEYCTGRKPPMMVAYRTAELQITTGGIDGWGYKFKDTQNRSKAIECVLMIKNYWDD